MVTNTQVGNIENQNDYAEFMYAKNAYIVATKNLSDTGDFTPNQFNIFWENLSIS